jgi:hypothetical protein
MELKDFFVGRLNGQQYLRTHQTDAYVEVPPALLITDACGDTWSLGSEYTQHGQVYEWNVLRNDVNIGEQAEKIVFRNGQVKIFGWYGWKVWSGKSFV